MIRRFLFSFLLLSIVAFAGPSRANDPAAVVETFHETLLSVMKEAETLGFDGRYGRIEKAMGAAYDLERMVRVATGSHWKKAANTQRAAMISAFTRMSAGTYASRFNGFDGEKFETIGTRPGPQKTTLVSTRIIDSDGKPVGLTYVMLRSGGAWRIVDVLLDDSISELAVRRSEYHQILRKGGPDALIRTLNEKADALGRH